MASWSVLPVVGFVHFVGLFLQPILCWKTFSIYRFRPERPLVFRFRSRRYRRRGPQNRMHRRQRPLSTRSTRVVRIRQLTETKKHTWKAWTKHQTDAAKPNSRGRSLSQELRRTHRRRGRRSRRSLLACRCALRRVVQHCRGNRFRSHCCVLIPFSYITPKLEPFVPADDPWLTALQSPPDAVEPAAFAPNIVAVSAGDVCDVSFFSTDRDLLVGCSCYSSKVRIFTIAFMFCCVAKWSQPSLTTAARHTRANCPPAPLSAHSPTSRIRINKKVCAL